MWLARKLVTWAPRGRHLLEPSAGRGNLLLAALEAGIAPSLLTAVELDPRWADHLRATLPGLRQQFCANFLGIPQIQYLAPSFGAVLMNPPYENNQHMQ